MRFLIRRLLRWRVLREELQRVIVEPVVMEAPNLNAFHESLDKAMGGAFRHRNNMGPDSQ